MHSILTTNLTTKSTTESTAKSRLYNGIRILPVASIAFCISFLTGIVTFAQPAVASSDATDNAGQSILVQSTTSTANSGLYDYLLPQFNEDHQIEVRVVAVGTGQAIRNASNCDADVLLVHAKSAEEQFVKDGYGIARFDLMYNDFVLIGPDNDPAAVANADTTTEALQQIAQTEALFASRGDDSGTHKKELTLWQAAGISPETAWYRSTGSGMGATLNTGIGLGAYILTDRASWITFGSKSDYKILHQGDASLFNQYGIIRVNDKICPEANVDASQTFIDWILSSKGQELISRFKIEEQQLFFPNATNQQ